MPKANLLMGGYMNHHRPAVPFREPQKEQLQGRPETLLLHRLWSATSIL